MCVLDESAFSPLTGERLLDLVFIQARGTIARLDQGANLLFANCGQGAAVIELARRFPRSRFLGLEASFHNLSIARADLLQNLWFEADAGQLPQLNASIDFALHQPNPRGATLAEVVRLLRNGGLLFALHQTLPAPADYHRENLTVIRHARLPDGFCTIARK